MDVVLSAIGLAMMLPLLVATAGLLALAQGRPVLFRQRRPGLAGLPFTLYKFRTMRDATDANGVPLPDADRMTRIGRLLRWTSIDELPELFNVLRGDMSLVGPRPLLTEYLDRYTARQARRHEVRPGITGQAQIHGRNDTSWEDRLEHDVRYVDDVSPGLDARILLRTVYLVLSRRGISAAGHATMPSFNGSTARDGDRIAARADHA